jgi:hypothetical protein
VKRKLKVFAIASLTEFFCYFILVANTRAFTLASYKWTFITDSLFITQSFFVQKWMVEIKDARGPYAFAGFLLGGTLGSLSAIWASTHLYGG